VGCLTRRVPFEGSRTRCGVPRTVAGPRCPSHEVGCSSEYFERRGCKRVGFPAPTLTSLFPGSLRGFTSTPAPVLSRVRVHPLMSFDLPFRVLPLRTCSALACGTPSLGFRSPSRHQRRESTRKRASQFSLFVPPTAFLTLSTAFSSPRLAGLFHPAATSGIHLSGAFSCCRAGPSRRWPVPSCRSAADFCRRVASTAPSSAAPPSGLWSGQQFEITDRVFSPGDASIPS
jgi:hypothetical protein